MKKQVSSIIIALLTATLILSGCTSAKSQGDATSNTIVSTQSGKIRGSVTESGVLSFKGVPYAEASERFVPAKPVAKWDGVRDATEYGKISPQSGILGMGGANAGEGTSNNCTNLNIWTPAIDEKKRAVMVWLHGGGFSTGSANGADCNGENLARTQDVVVVGVNHRLNVFGHLDLSAFGEKYKYSANSGMYDIIQALEWIQANITNFGGDPNNVTIFGESGGGAKVLAMMTSPKAKGLFHKAINESGATENMGVEFQRADYSRELGELIVSKLGLNSSSIEAIQSVDAEKLMNAAAEAQNEISQKYRLPVSIGEGYAMEWEPVVDRDFLPTNPVLEKGFAAAGKDIPLLIGSNLNEWTIWMPVTAHPNMSDEARAEYAKAYPSEDKATAPLVDTLLRLPLLKITAHKADQNGAKVYSYIFTKQVNERLGASHTTEIPYVFANTEDPLSKTSAQRGRTLQRTVFRAQTDYRSGKPTPAKVEL